MTFEFDCSGSVNCGRFRSAPRPLSILRPTARSASGPLFSIHHIRKNVIDAREVSFTLVFKPVEYSRVQPDADGHLARTNLPRPDHVR
jgi:hypothetical protein